VLIKNLFKASFRIFVGCVPYLRKKEVIHLRKQNPGFRGVVEGKIDD